MHIPNPGREPNEDEPGREIPRPPVRPDMEPVVPQRDPPKPGQPDVPGEPPPIIA